MEGSRRAPHMADEPQVGWPAETHDLFPNLVHAANLAGMPRDVLPAYSDGQTKQRMKTRLHDKLLKGSDGMNRPFSLSRGLSRSARTGQSLIGTLSVFLHLTIVNRLRSAFGRVR
jgi:hypothetical protein